ncbi:hypothetical protein [Rheinheimera sp.]|uniref:hypothetical protein n=1 Tax=Rheinheimera sp. TaxID=1869214 RepID=UPI00307E83E0
MLKQSGCVLIALLLAACQQTPKTEQGAATNTTTEKAAAIKTAQHADNNKLVCEQSRTTGSLIKGKRCRTKQRIEEERRDSQEMIEGIRANSQAIAIDR